MTRISALAATILLLVLVPAAHACDYPARIDVPNGMTATKEQMMEGQRDVKSYVAAMETYLDCLLEEEKAARSQMDNLSAEDEQLREDLLNKKYNAAVDEMETVAALFNAEVRAYRSRND